VLIRVAVVGGEVEAVEVVDSLLDVVGIVLDQLVQVANV